MPSSDAHHLLVSFSGRPHGFVDEALAALGRKRRIVLTVNQFTTAGIVVARSDLLTVLPRDFLSATGVEHRLVLRTLPLALASVSVEMVWHLRRAAEPAHVRLRERLGEIAAARPPASRASLAQAHPRFRRSPAGQITAAIALAVASTLPGVQAGDAHAAGADHVDGDARRAGDRPAAPSAR